MQEGEQQGLRRGGGGRGGIDPGSCSCKQVSKAKLPLASHVGGICNKKPNNKTHPSAPPTPPHPYLAHQSVQLAGAQPQLGQAAVGRDAQHRLLRILGRSGKVV